MINVAVIGLAHPHILTMIQEVLACPDLYTITAILADKDAPSHVEQALNLCPSATLYQDEEELYASAKVDAVLSSAVFCQKSDLAVRVLQHKKHLMFDKPLSISKKGINAIETELNKNPDLKIALWLTERYNPTYYTAKTLIDQGEIGEIVHMNFVRPHRLAPDTRPYWHLDAKYYGGILSDIGVHDADLARWFSQSECKRIEGAHVGTKRFKNYPMQDHGIATLIMESGVSCHLFENWLTPDAFPLHGDTRAVIYGTKGQIEVKAYPESVTLCTDEKAPHPVKLVAPPVSSVADFAHSLTAPSYKPIMTTSDAILSTKLAIAMQIAAESSLN